MRRSTARGSGPDDVRLCHADLLHGAKLQLRGALRMKVRVVATVCAPIYYNQGISTHY
jgi:hypothetical protein